MMRFSILLEAIGVLWFYFGSRINIKSRNRCWLMLVWRLENKDLLLVIHRLKKILGKGWLIILGLKFMVFLEL